MNIPPTIRRLLRGRITRHAFWPRYLLGHAFICLVLWFAAPYYVHIKTYATFPSTASTAPAESGKSVSASDIAGHIEITQHKAFRWLFIHLYIVDPLPKDEEIIVSKQYTPLPKRKVKCTITHTHYLDGQKVFATVSQEVIEANTYSIVPEAPKLDNKIIDLSRYPRRGAHLYIPLTLLSLICALYLLSISIFRLRDAGFKPWYLLCILIKFGVLVPLILFCLPSKNTAEEQK